MRIRLGQVCDLSAGLPAAPRTSSSRSVTIDVIGIRAVLTDGRIDLAASETLQVSANPEPRKAILRHDVLLALRGTPKAGLVTNTEPRIIYASSNLAILRPRYEIDPAFLWAAVQRECRDGGQLATFAIGTVQRSLRMKDIADLEILLPPLEAQQAIGRAVLSIQNAIIAQRAATNAAEQMLESFLVECLSS